MLTNDTIDNYVWLAGLTDQQLADATMDSKGHEGKFVQLDYDVLEQAHNDGRRRDSILREHVRQMIQQWIDRAKVTEFEYKKLIDSGVL